MLRAVRYFQAVVKYHSFSDAAEACHISQSAISQQIKALEQELGFSLFVRHHRTFSLTPAGELFYRKSLILLADYEAMCREAERLACGSVPALHIGYLNGGHGDIFLKALDQFRDGYPEVSVQTQQGTHEALFTMLREGKADMVLNDQRRAFSPVYRNCILSVRPCSIEISTRSRLAGLDMVTVDELKNTPCIVIANASQQKAEQDYYRQVMGFAGEIRFAGNLEEARLLSVSGGGFLVTAEKDPLPDALVRIPLFQHAMPVMRTDCAFWKKENPNPYIESFAAILKNLYEEG